MPAEAHGGPERQLDAHSCHHLFAAVALTLALAGCGDQPAAPLSPGSPAPAPLARIASTAGVAFTHITVGQYPYRACATSATHAYCWGATGAAVSPSEPVPVAATK